MRCPYCRHDIRVSGRHCPRCGRQVFGSSGAGQSRVSPPENYASMPVGPATLYAPPPTARSMPHPDPIPAYGDVVGKTCPYDQYPISEGDQVIICPDCATPHHADCWQENGGCTTYGCARAPAPPAPAMPPARAGTAPGAPVAPARPAGWSPHRLPVSDGSSAVATLMAAELDRRAGNALMYSLIGLPCCPVLSIIGFFMAVSVFATLGRINVNSTGARMKATWALVVGALAPVVWITVMIAMTDVHVT